MTAPLPGDPSDDESRRRELLRGGKSYSRPDSTVRIRAKQAAGWFGVPAIIAVVVLAGIDRFEPIENHVRFSGEELIVMVCVGALVLAFVWILDMHIH